MNLVWVRDRWRGEGGAIHTVTTHADCIKYGGLLTI
jgi:hypothetical protein